MTKADLNFLSKQRERNTMGKFPYKAFLECMPMFLSQSDSQMSSQVRDKLASVVNRPHTERELYDAMAEIAALPIVPVAPKLVSGEISSFVKSFCDVTKFYERP